MKNSTFYFLNSKFFRVLLLSVFYFLFSAIQVAYAHEEGATSVTFDNITGPILTLIIIILAVVVARRIKKIKISSPAKIFKENLGGQE